MCCQGLVDGSQDQAGKQVIANSSAEYQAPQHRMLAVPPGVVPQLPSDWIVVNVPMDAVDLNRTSGNSDSLWSSQTTLAEQPLDSCLPALLGLNEIRQRLASYSAAKEKNGDTADPGRAECSVTSTTRGGAGTNPTATVPISSLSARLAGRQIFLTPGPSLASCLHPSSRTPNLPPSMCHGRDASPNCTIQNAPAGNPHQGRNDGLRLISSCTDSRNDIQAALHLSLPQPSPVSLKSTFRDDATALSTKSVDVANVCWFGTGPQRTSDSAKSSSRPCTPSCALVDDACMEARHERRGRSTSASAMASLPLSIGLLSGSQQMQASIELVPSKPEQHIVTGQVSAGNDETIPTKQSTLHEVLAAALVQHFSDTKDRCVMNRSTVHSNTVKPADGGDRSQAAQSGLLASMLYTARPTQLSGGLNLLETAVSRGQTREQPHTVPFSANTSSSSRQIPLRIHSAPASRTASLPMENAWTTNMHSGAPHSNLGSHLLPRKNDRKDVSMSLAMAGIPDSKNNEPHGLMLGSVANQSTLPTSSSATAARIGQGAGAQGTAVDVDLHVLQSLAQLVAHGLNNSELECAELKQPRPQVVIKSEPRTVTPPVATGNNNSLVGLRLDSYHNSGRVRRRSSSEASGAASLSLAPMVKRQKQGDATPSYSMWERAPHNTDGVGYQLDTAEAVDQLTRQLLLKGATSGAAKLLHERTVFTSDGTDNQECHGQVTAVTTAPQLPRVTGLHIGNAITHLQVQVGEMYPADQDAQKLFSDGSGSQLSPSDVKIVRSPSSVVFCEHNRIKCVCRDCGGGSICTHKRVRSKCKECGGGSICAHNRVRSQCKDCKGGSICVHGRQRTYCKACGGGSVCEHGRARSKCKECGGGSICQHSKVRSKCKQCGGGSICEHGKRRSECKPCGGGSICEHNRVRSKCKECGGGAICQHNKVRSKCKDCKGGSICPHRRQRWQCKDCNGKGICVHQRVRSVCKECGGGGICLHNKVRSQCKECKAATASAKAAAAGVAAQSTSQPLAFLSPPSSAVALIKSE